MKLVRLVRYDIELSQQYAALTFPSRMLLIGAILEFVGVQ